MSTAQLFLIEDNTSDTVFRTWGSAISAQLDACGWTKTGDSGQVNWTTVTVPATNAYVYEIRQPANDPLQTGGTAYYIKLEYGTKSTSYPSLRITIGTGTNGSGTLTGFVSTVLAAMGGSTGTVVPNLTFECDFSWDVSRMAVLLWRTSSSGNSAFFAIERTKDTAGVDTTDGVTVVVAVSQSSGTQMQSIIFGVGVTNLLGSLACIKPSMAVGTSDAFGGAVPVSPIFPSYGKYGNPHTIVAIAPLSDIPEGALISSVLYGVSHVYLNTKAVNPFVNTACFLMRYE